MFILAGLMALTLAPQPSGVAQQVLEISGIVDQMDRSGRVVTIKSADGLYTPVYVGPELPIFDQLARGDRLTVRVYDSYIVEATPGARMKPLEDTTAAAQQKLDRADAGVLQQLRLVVTIDTIDRSNNTVTYHGVDNRRVMRAVRDPRLLEGLEVGDVVTITYTRARAATIDKQP